MEHKRAYKYGYVLIFGLALFLRFSMVLLNREANDAHETVAKIIAQTGRLPQKADCWECFQPKLFHATFGSLLKVFGMAANPGYQQNVVGQFINFIAAIITLAIVYVFVRGLAEFDEKTKLFAFSLVALNPALIGINSQATNDTFVILFSTLAVFFAYRFLKYEKIRDLVACGLFLILDISSKSNAWVAFIAILIAFLIWAVYRSPRAKKLLTLLIFLVAVIGISVINPLNQYIPNIQVYGSPILMNVDRAPLPRFSGAMNPHSLGIRYIGDGFFTFKFISLLKHPRIDKYPPVYLPHQTSLWTILYGKAHSIHFDNAPPSWGTRSERLFPFLRILYILALLPTALLLFGAARELYDLSVGFIKQSHPAIQANSYGLFILLFLGYMAFEVLYALEYRTIGVLKAIFLLPALLSFPYLFMKALRDLYSLISRIHQRWVSYLVDSAFIALLACYAIDVTILILTLARLYLVRHQLI